MVVKMSSPGRSFGGVADYCLHDPRMPGEAHHPESAERVEWTETRNLATSEGERAGRIMAATAEASPELKRLAGVAATGRKLEKAGVPLFAEFGPRMRSRTGKRCGRYNQRSRIETQMGRWKSVIGPKLKSRSFSRQITEIQLGRKVLNTMTALGRPVFERIA